MTNLFKDREKFEEEIFNISVIYVIFFSLVSLIIDYFIVGIGLLQYIYTADMFLLVGVYFLNKKFNYLYLILPFSIISLTTVLSVWILNGGVFGAGPYLLFAFIIVILLIVPNNNRIITFIILLIIYFLLIVVEIIYPEIIINTTLEEDRKFELIISIFILLNAIFLVLNKFLNQLNDSYDREKEYLETISITNSELKDINKNLENKIDTLQYMNKVQRQLQTIIVHDIKSPILSVRNGLDMLDEDIHKSLNKDDLRFYKSIKDSIGRVSLVIDNLLMMTKIEGKSLQLKTEQFNLRSQIIEELVLVDTTAKLKNIKILNKVGEGQKVIFDKNIFSIIFRNLIINAIKYSNKNSNIEIYSNLKDNKYEIMIKDYGVGIEEEYIVNISEGINMQSIVSNKSETGTGLGLKIISALLKTSNQSFNIKSEVEKGTEVYFTIPKSN